jgi:hypothetical protein
MRAVLILALIAGLVWAPPALVVKQDVEVAKLDSRTLQEGVADSLAATARSIQAKTIGLGSKNVTEWIDFGQEFYDRYIVSGMFVEVLTNSPFTVHLPSISQTRLIYYRNLSSLPYSE